MAVELRNRDASRKAPDRQKLTSVRCRGDLAQLVELGGDRFVLRRIQAEDSRAYCAFIARMDEADLRRRFGGLERELPNAGRARVIRIDDREIAFVAIRQAGPSNGEIVGEVRAYRYPAGSAAEVTMMVRSDMQRRGLGRALLEKMIEYCQADGLELIARILSENKPTIRLAQRCGMHVEYLPGSDVAIAHIGDSK